MPIKILAIDDSKTMRLAIKITFAAEDAQVVAVSKGSEAIPRAKQHGADIILIDHTLAPGEPSGLQVVQELKANPATAQIPVILLIPTRNGVTEADALAAGADAAIAKPFDSQELIDRVTGVLTGQKPKLAAPVAARPAATPAVKPPVAATPAVKPPVAATPAVKPPVAATRPVATPATKPVAAPPTAAKPVAAPPTAAKPVATPATKPVAAKPATTPATPAATPVARPAATVPGVRTAATAQPAAQPAAARPAAAASSGSFAGPIPIARPIPFTAAASPTPGMLERLRAAGSGATAGLDPAAIRALLQLSQEVVEQVVWEVVPDLAEQMIKEQMQQPR